MLIGRVSRFLSAPGEVSYVMVFFLYWYKLNNNYIRKSFDVTPEISYRILLLSCRVQFLKLTPTEILFGIHLCYHWVFWSHVFQILIGSVFTSWNGEVSPAFFFGLKTLLSSDWTLSSTQMLFFIHFNCHDVFPLTYGRLQNLIIKKYPIHYVKRWSF